MKQAGFCINSLAQLSLNQSAVTCAATPVTLQSCTANAGAHEMLCILKVVDRGKFRCPWQTCSGICWPSSLLVRRQRLCPAGCLCQGFHQVIGECAGRSCHRLQVHVCRWPLKVSALGWVQLLGIPHPVTNADPRHAHPWGRGLSVSPAQQAKQCKPWLQKVWCLYSLPCIRGQAAAAVELGYWVLLNLLENEFLQFPWFYWILYIVSY